MAAPGSPSAAASRSEGTRSPRRRTSPPEAACAILNKVTTRSPWEKGRGEEAPSRPHRETGSGCPL